MENLWTIMKNRVLEVGISWTVIMEEEMGRFVNLNLIRERVSQKRVMMIS
jgi:hypothetical protein